MRMSEVIVHFPWANLSFALCGLSMVFLPNWPVVSLPSVSFSEGCRFTFNRFLDFAGTSGVLQALIPAPEKGKNNSVNLRSPFSSPTPRGQCCFYQKGVDRFVFESHTYTVETDVDRGQRAGESKPVERVYVSGRREGMFLRCVFSPLHATCCSGY